MRAGNENEDDGIVTHSFIMSRRVPVLGRNHSITDFTELESPNGICWALDFLRFRHLLSAAVLPKSQIHSHRPDAGTPYTPRGISGASLKKRGTLIYYREYR